MSGIVGIVHLDGSPVPCELLRKLTEFLIFRGPDGDQTWINSSVGFGHTRFKTNEESERDSQPLTLDGQTWIVADARIDAREEIVAELRSSGHQGIAASDWTDAELILLAYQAWGERCVEKLLGDFAFGIWDGPRRRLFCARDHMGVKPFYYAKIGSCVIFSNTINCIRQHPYISDKLNELAVADFLLFGLNQERATTSFADIQRIPPAHCATWSKKGSNIRRYWSLPIEDPISYKRPDDYVGHFHELLDKCVGDRLRSNRVSVFMSGGLDSPTLAATAHKILRGRYTDFELRAFTQVDSSLPEERNYAGMVADYLHIPIEYRSSDDTRCDLESVSPGLPEPFPDGNLTLAERQSWIQREDCTRVFLYGEGPDNALILDWQPYVRHLIRNRRYRLLARDAVATFLATKRPPFWGRISRRLAFGRNSHDDPKPDYPGWLNSGFESRLQLRDRWHALNSAKRSLHPIRPMAYESLQIPLWQFLFERFDPGVSRLRLEVRHPFVDVRMLRFMLALPPLPWCRSKYLIRKCMAGKLPKAVLDRRKATIAVRDVRSSLAKLCQAPFTPTPEICKFIDPQRINRLAPDYIESTFRILNLNHWLQTSYRSSRNAIECCL